MADCESFIPAPGGAPANVAVGLARLGVRSAFLGVVGADPFGRRLRSVLAEEGVDTRWLHEHPSVRTTLAFVGLDRSGSPDFVFYRHPGADQMLSGEMVRDVCFKGVRWLHFGTLSQTDSPARESTLEAVSRALEAGCRVSFDPNLRSDLWPDPQAVRDVVERSLPGVNLVKLSEGEARFLYGGVEDALPRFLARGVRLVAVTRGSGGALLVTPGAAASVRSPRTEVVDTTGAGDAFMASLLASMVEMGDAVPGREDLARMGRRACTAGALACRRAGAIPALPRIEELDAAFAEEVPTSRT